MVFLGIILFYSFWAKRGTKQAQIENFQLLSEVSAHNFSGILHEVTEIQLIFWENFALNFLVQF